MILYKTVKKEAVAEQIIDKSKFIAHIKPVETREEADEFIKNIRKKHRNATHNVPVIVIGEKFQVQWASDDGEPQGTSGAPILSMLINEEITNVVVVVTRYFGGIKLGTGGLVRAYTGSAKLALEAGGIAEVKEVGVRAYRIDYNFLKSIQNLEKAGRFKIGKIDYGEKIILECLTERENMELVYRDIIEVTNGKAEMVSEKIAVIRI